MRGNVVASDNFYGKLLRNAASKILKFLTGTPAYRPSFWDHRVSFGIPKACFNQHLYSKVFFSILMRLERVRNSESSIN